MMSAHGVAGRTAAPRALLDHFEHGCKTMVDEGGFRGSGRRKVEKTKRGHRGCTAVGMLRCSRGLRTWEKVTMLLEAQDRPACRWRMALENLGLELD